ncbi:membrane protein [Bacteroidia bacterium]|nr:membrane protein [Bacteroidia bacterium]
MNKIKYFAIASLLLCGCDDFLKDEPYGPSTSEDFWKTETDVKSALNAFIDYNVNEGVYGRGVYWFENCSDDMFTGRPQGPSDAYTCERFQMGANNNLDANATWPAMYQMIAKANNVFRYVPGMSISDEVKSNAIGQAHFYRAFAYLWLCPWYGDNGPINGGIPIVTEDTPLDDMDQPRPESVLANYDMIINDMEEAAKRLPLLSQLSADDYGRPYKTAAWAFAARAALYAAQYDAENTGNPYYTKVIALCDSIMNLTGADYRELHTRASTADTSLGLKPSNFSDLFRWENNFSSEYIFSLLGNEKRGPKFHGMFFSAGGFSWYNTWGYFMPTLELYNAFEPNDTRRDATILSPGQHIQFIGHDVHWCLNPTQMYSESGMTNRKFMSIFEAEDCVGKYVNVSGNNQSNRLAVSLMRYADILLMKAEALIWTQGEGNAEAKRLIDLVRVRAGLAPNSTATKDELKKERRLEFAFEFFPSRHLDLVRWKDAQKTYAKPTTGWKVETKDDLTRPIWEDEAKTTQKKDALGNLLYEKMLAGLTVNTVRAPREFDPDIHHVFPIPAGEVNRSKNLRQNKGY